MQNKLRQSTTVLLFLLVIAPLKLLAQTAQMPAVGGRMRVQIDAAPTWRVGYLASTDSAGVTLKQYPSKLTSRLMTPQSQPYAVQYSAMRSLEVSRGKYGRAERGVVGALAGALVGTVVLGAAGWALSQCSDCEESGIGFLFGLVYGPPLGALFGGMAGVATAPERWESVGIPTRKNEPRN